VFYKSSPFGEIRVVDRPDPLGGDPENAQIVRRLLIDGRGQCETISDASERHFVETALSALSGRGREIRALNIGLGCGLTLHSIVRHPRVAAVDVVEINPVIAEAAEYFDRHTKGALKDPRVTLIMDDGFHFLRQPQSPYDLIAVDVEDPSVMYSSPLYTVEFFHQVKQALKPDGIFTLWAYSSCGPAHSAIYATLKQVFPYVDAKTSGRYQEVYFFASLKDMSGVLSLTAADQAHNRQLRNASVTAVNTMNRPALTGLWQKCAGPFADPQGIPLNGQY
jgi:spermidine synthase